METSPGTIAYGGALPIANNSKFLNSPGYRRRRQHTEELTPNSSPLPTTISVQFTPKI
ncbi:hypothetical protein [Nodularia sp. UHCC 0506]|uniref:hypothetical protein n=1 Tax=Nodularia sp. UHCC 0506 TaxID=3110243 RepID=UPI002B1EC96D|nr:hypothetical protein [Nodularia sp. UHCC 0506]MEA5517296.1 hypothetical protein [Nodularia sp. UHCC 0506]